MLLGEVTKRLDDVLLDVRGIVGVIVEDVVGEVGVVDRVVDGDGDLVAFVVVDDGAGDTCPHRLKNKHMRWELKIINSRVETYDETDEALNIGPVAREGEPAFEGVGALGGEVVVGVCRCHLDVVGREGREALGGYIYPWETSATPKGA